MDIRKIKGKVKDYAWGNDDFIPSLIGGFTGKPQAELWFGTHPSGESCTEDGIPLSKLIAEDRSILGEEAYGRFSGKLPLLFKVLAIAKPLSLQCHPDKKQAEEGWERETEYRKAGQLVSYQDRNMKSEMIIIFTLLLGTGMTVAIMLPAIMAIPATDCTAASTLSLSKLRIIAGSAAL